MSDPFPTLFSPLTIRGATLRNRIFSTGHETLLVEGTAPGEPLIAYHEARAKGGAGLIIVEIGAVHPTGVFNANSILAYTDDCIEGYAKLADAVHAHGCCIFGQLFHPGREVFSSVDGSAAHAYAPSAVPNERFHIMPQPMSRDLIAEIVAGYGDAAARMRRAGLDGVEIVGSHGYLPAQFLSPRVNLRDDEYGGSDENRLRFLREVIADIRAKVDDDAVVGMRITGDGTDAEMLTLDEAGEACMALDGDGGLDYFNVIAGSSGTLGGAVHIVPSMFIETGYVAPYAAAIRERVTKPVFVAGRINQPQIAEEILVKGQADMCGMTRAQICDPELANKAKAGRSDDIRACIACNQACIGHMMTGYSISCIQRPETGRELAYGTRKAAAAARKVLVAGGGPAGMKAACVAAERGHAVTLYEAAGQLGGQVLLAQALPNRAEFGGLVTNFTREMELAGVAVERNMRVDRALIEREAPDAVIVATGARPRRPALDGLDSEHVVDAWQVLRNEANVGASVLVADWRCDWIGLGIAEKLAREGCRVRLAVAGFTSGQMLQPYIRDQWTTAVRELGVEIIPYARLFGMDDDTVYLQQVISDEAIVCDGVETLVLALGHERVAPLEAELADWPGEVALIGDCASPRTVEEATLDALKVASLL